MSERDVLLELDDVPAGWRVVERRGRHTLIERDDIAAPPTDRVHPDDGYAYDGCTGPSCRGIRSPALPSAPDHRLRLWDVIRHMDTFAAARERDVRDNRDAPDNINDVVARVIRSWIAVLSEATPSSEPPGLAAQIEWQIGNAYRNGHRDGLACGVESAGFGFTECEHLTEDGYRPSSDPALDVARHLVLSAVGAWADHPSDGPYIHEYEAQMLDTYTEYLRLSASQTPEPDIK